MPDPLLAAWDVNHRVDLALLEKISDEGMKATTSTRGGRDVARQFAHLHNVRLWWLEARAKDLAVGLEAFATDDSPSRARLRTALEASRDAVARWIERGLEAGPKAKSPGPHRTLAYFVAHESHHRGNILLTLKLTGHPIDRETQYAIWGLWTAKGGSDGGAKGGLDGGGKAPGSGSQAGPRAGSRAQGRARK